MIAKVLLLVCVAFGCVAGSCFEIRKPCASQLVAVESTPVCNQGISGEVAVGSFDNSFSNGCGCGSSALNYGDNSVVGFNNNNVNNNGFFGNGLDALTEPETKPLPVLQAPAVTLRTVESPLVTLSAPAVPAPRVLASRCVCTKTIVRPQVFQRIVTVPKVQRYLKRTVTPVVENLIYKSRPIATSFGFNGNNGFNGFNGNNGVNGLNGNNGNCGGFGLVSRTVVGTLASDCSCNSSPVVVSEPSTCRSC